MNRIFRYPNEFADRQDVGNQGILFSEMFDDFGTIPHSFDISLNTAKQSKQ